MEGRTGRVQSCSLRALGWAGSVIGLRGDVAQGAGGQLWEAPSPSTGKGWLGPIVTGVLIERGNLHTNRYRGRRCGDTGRRTLSTSQGERLQTDLPSGGTNLPTPAFRASNFRNWETILFCGTWLQRPQRTKTLHFTRHYYRKEMGTKGN